MSPPSGLWLALLIGATTAVALVRLVLWRRGAKASEAGPVWRYPALIALNIFAAGLLYLTLAPPDVGVRSGRLVVRTEAASTAPDLQPGDVLVALPEASGEAGQRVPDLATVLRRHPEAGVVRVLGAGLTERDRVSVDRTVVFDPPARPVGFIRLNLPRPVGPGGPFAVSGGIGAMAAGTAELADPSGTVVDRVAVTAGGNFVLEGAARAAGLALFELRLKDTRDLLVERIDVPVEARQATPPRVIVMAGAPGPEPRFLRRWAEEAGIDLSVQLALGAGVDLTTRPATLTAANLSDTDLLVVDERRWEALTGSERAAVRSAVGNGMGLLLRPTGPLSDPTRRDWADLGAPLSGGENLRPLALEGTSETVRGPEGLGETVDPGPELTRRDFVQGGSEAAVLLEDADGSPLATWRPYGTGRVGVWVVADSYALVLSGQVDRYGALWSRMFSTLSRPEGEAPPYLVDFARAGHRAALCGLTAEDTVVGPDGTRIRPILDPRAGPSGCAAVWPQRSGWHAIMSGQNERGVVFVQPADAAPSLLSAQTTEATNDLVQSGTNTGITEVTGRSSGSPWPWFLGLLAALTGLWWLERRRAAVTSSSNDPPLS